MRRRWALALSLGVVLAAGTAWAADPQDVVHQLYAEPGLAFGGPGSQQVLSADLASALHARAAGALGPGPVDFDYRYGARETEISGFMLLTQIDNDRAKVVAVFKNFGKAESVDWTLCRTPGGDWRVADAASNTGPQAWELRQMLGLRSDQVSC